MWWFGALGRRAFEGFCEDVGSVVLSGSKYLTGLGCRVSVVLGLGLGCLGVLGLRVKGLHACS